MRGILRRRISTVPEGPHPRHDRMRPRRARVGKLHGQRSLPARRRLAVHPQIRHRRRSGSIAVARHPIPIPRGSIATRLAIIQMPVRPELQIHRHLPGIPDRPRLTRRRDRRGLREIVSAEFVAPDAHIVRPPVANIQSRLTHMGKGSRGHNRDSDARRLGGHEDLESLRGLQKSRPVPAGIPPPVRSPRDPRDAVRRVPVFRNKHHIRPRGMQREPEGISKSPRPHPRAHRVDISIEPRIVRQTDSRRRINAQEFSLEEIHLLRTVAVVIVAERDNHRTRILRMDRDVARVVDVRRARQSGEHDPLGAGLHARSRGIHRVTHEPLVRIRRVEKKQMPVRGKLRRHGHAQQAGFIPGPHPIADVQKHRRRAESPVAIGLEHQHPPLFFRHQQTPRRQEPDLRGPVPRMDRVPREIRIHQLPRDGAVWKHDKKKQQGGEEAMHGEGQQ